MRHKLQSTIFGVALVLAAIFAAAGRGWLGIGTAREMSPQERWSALETRPLRGRLAGLAEYRPYQPASTTPVFEVEQAQLLRGAEPEIEERALRRITTNAAGALLDGWGCPRAPRDLAIATESAAGSTSWQVWNDLAAALLECAPKEPERAGQALSQRLEAFEAVSRALTLKPSSPEAVFNRALILESLPLSGRAGAAWESYLAEIDGSSGWAEEARERLAALAGVAGGSLEPIDLRNQVELDLLPQWSAALERGDVAAASELRAQLDSVIALLGSAGSLHRASVATLADAAKQPEVAAELARGHRLYAEAVALYRAEKAAPARNALEQALTAFKNAESPFGLRVELRRLWASENADLPAIETVLAAADQQGFRWAAAEAARLLAWRKSRQGALVPALDLYEDAERRFRDVGSAEEAAVVASMRAQLLMQLSRPEEALGALAVSIPEIPQMDDAWNRYASLWVSAEAVRPSAPRASTEIQREALLACGDLPERPLCRLDLLIALTRVPLPSTEAAEILDQAEAELAGIERSEGLTRTSADLSLARARLLLESPTLDAADEALALIAPSLALYREGNLDVSTAKAQLTLATALEALGRSTEARTELRQALENVRRWDAEQRSRPEAAEAGSPATLRELFERLIVLAVEDGDDEESFLLAEEMRNRLAPTLGPAPQPPAWRDVEAALSAIPRGTAVVEYAVISPRRTGEDPTALAWVLVDGRFERIELSGAEELGSRLKRLRRYAAFERLELWREESAALWHDWMAPVVERLSAGTARLLIVPDSELFDLPFRALLDPASGRYLDQDFTIALAPSLGMLAAAPAKRGTDSSPSVLSLGFSTFNGRGHRRLPNAEDEARQVEEAYGRGQSVSCAGEDWLSLRACLPRARVVHLVTHAAASSRPGSRSWLALPAEDLDLKRLWKELPELPETELVVLAACESVAAPAGGEGLGGLARPLLARGTHAVVGTLQPIEDAAARAFFPTFHRAFAASGDAAGALREAREQLPNWESKPWEWGRVEVIVQGWD